LLATALLGAFAADVADVPANADATSIDAPTRASAAAIEVLMRIELLPSFSFP
jgi:hypothetical protein